MAASKSLGAALGPQLLLLPLLLASGASAGARTATSGPEAAGEQPIARGRFSPSLRAPAMMQSSEAYLEGRSLGPIRLHELGLVALGIKYHSTVYSDLFVHQYASMGELRASGGPQVNQELCLGQLERLYRRQQLAARLSFESRDLELAQLLDTFGHLPSGLYQGNLFWEGNWRQCERLTLSDTDPEPGPHHQPAGNATSGAPQRWQTRYCVASFKHSSWPQRGAHFDDAEVLKLGACLPKACDSLNYKHKYQLVQRVLELEHRRAGQDEFRLTALYCLPDPEAPMAQWWRSPAALAMVVGVALWLCLLAFATLKDELAPQCAPAASGLGLTTGFQVAKPLLSLRQQLYRSLSVSRNLRQLFDTTKATSLLQLAGPATSGPPPAASQRVQLVRLDCIEGIKVLAMVYIFNAHVLMVMSMIMADGVNLDKTVTFFMSNLAPAFAVNSFFTITGMLTCYLLFKQNQSQAFICKPHNWLAFVVYRYLRIMPTYALMVAYTKYLAKFAAGGPLWDYGTSPLGARRACEREPWLWTLLLGSNLRSPLDNCIPSAWYLANDFQYFVVTPIFLWLLHKWARAGKRLLAALTLACQAFYFWAVLNTPTASLRPVAKFQLHAFRTYIDNLGFTYSLPHYRLGAYLVGLLVGFLLFEYEQRARAHLAKLELARLASREDKNNNEENNNHNNNNNNNNTLDHLADSDLDEARDACWPRWLVRFGAPLSGLVVCVCVLTPYIGRQIPFSERGAKLLVALVLPGYHLLFSASVGLYLLVATTAPAGRRAPLRSLLAGRLWKPLARVSLCALLCNIEVIKYILHGEGRMYTCSDQFQTMLNLTCACATFGAALVLCLLFEAPSRACLNLLLAQAMTRLAPRKRKLA